MRLEAEKVQIVVELLTRSPALYRKRPFRRGISGLECELVPCNLWNQQALESTIGRKRADNWVDKHIARRKSKLFDPSFAFDLDAARSRAAGVLTLAGNQCWRTRQRHIRDRAIDARPESACSQIAMFSGEADASLNIFSVFGQ